MATLGRATLVAVVSAIAAISPAVTRPAAGGGSVDSDAAAALNALYESTPEARDLAKSARGILVFPNIVKAGFLFGGQYGTGALLVNGKTVGHYNISAASYGLQAGIQNFGYALFFMSQPAFDYLIQSGGFEIGVGPSLVVVDQAIAKTLTTTTVREDVYAFTFHQKGLMAGAGLQGSKITRIGP